MKKIKKCTLEGCDGKYYSNGLCPKHYHRLKRYGEVNLTKFRGKTEALEFIQKAFDVDSDRCIIWPFPKGKGGYGKITVKNKQYSAHRYVCLLAHGEPSPEQTDAAHNCGNSSCINPNHLRWATRKENWSDRYIHGTDTRGSKHAQVKLNEDIVKEILKSKESGVYLSNKYGVTTATISSIRKGKTWKHVSRD